jgi:hypothetical protein
MGRACSMIGEEKRIQGFDGNGRKTQLGRPKCRWVNNIKLDLRERMGR